MSILSLIDNRTNPLSEGWSLLFSEPGAYALPGDLPKQAETIPAIVPGTVAGALDAAGRFDRQNPESLIDRDVWYCLSLAGERPGPALLRFEGLATIAEVFLDDRLILRSQSMFESHDVPVNLSGTETLFICFRALKPHLEKTGPRARWRPRLMNNQGLRLNRSTALGFMPGWSPEIHPVGPWRPVLLVRRGDLPITFPFVGEIGRGANFAHIGHVDGLRISASLNRLREGVLKVSFTEESPKQILYLLCAGHDTPFTFADGRYSAELRIPNIEAWWPHTHGEPALHDIKLRVDGTEYPLAHTGFRHIEINRGKDGNDFALILNGEKIFCRGSVWTSADIARLPGDRASYEPWLRLAKDAGMNMIRIPGIATYESPEFFALCDELGLMIWQDLMFANFDYPATDPDFLLHVKSEVGQFLKATEANPSLAVICGGSEIWQQGAMLGLPERIWKGPLCTEILPAIVDDLRPDLPYVANSPSGGALPFYPNAGVAHYYGVGAYNRPLEDARRANIRFAAECLAFSNLADDETLAGGKAGIPRDTGADWDFEDVRDHYIGVLYGSDSQQLRRNDFERYLALSRAVTGEVMEATFAEWRRAQSSCNGALTFTFQDVMPGPGWGVIGVDGRPKPAWFALKRAFRPVQAMFVDEGTNGLDIHLLNETAATLPVMLEVSCLRDGRMPVVSGRRELMLGARGSERIACTDLFGAFFDANYAYRFGPPSHDVVVAHLINTETGETLAEAFHFPLGRGQAMHDAEITVSLVESGSEFALELSADFFAQSVMIAMEGHQPSDDGFHLAPGSVKRITLVPRAGFEPNSSRSGSIRSLGSNRITRF